MKSQDKKQRTGGLPLDIKAGLILVAGSIWLCFLLLVDKWSTTKERILYGD